jgi:hypothetical protein
MKAIRLAFTALGICIAFSSCKKDKNNTPDEKSPDVALKEVFDSLASNYQEFTVNAGAYDTIITNGGLRIMFHPESFLDPNGNILNSGPIAIKIKDVLNYKDMVRNRVQTITRGESLLQSGGSYHIEAYAAGTSVALGVNDYMVFFPEPNNVSSSTMALFEGYTYTGLAGNTIRWENDTAQNTQLTSLDEINNKNILGYLFDSCTSLNWINCDYFVNDPGPRANLSITMPDNSFTQTNTEVWVLVPRLNATLLLYGYRATDFSFIQSPNPSNHLPAIGAVDIITLTFKNNKYYFSKTTNVALHATTSVNVTPIEKSFSDIINEMNNL